MALNLGHYNVLTTFLSYGQVRSPGYGEIIRGLATPQLTTPFGVAEIVRAVVREMRHSGDDVLVTGIGGD